MLRMLSIQYKQDHLPYSCLFQARKKFRICELDDRVVDAVVFAYPDRKRFELYVTFHVSIFKYILSKILNNSFDLYFNQPYLMSYITFLS